MSRMTARVLLAAASLLVACAGPRAPGPARSRMIWPVAGAPRARLARVLPDPATPRPRPSVLRRAWNAIAGLDEEDPAAGLVRPFAVAVAPDGALLVADPDAPGVFRLGSRGAAPEPVLCKGQEWAGPMALAIGGDGELYVADAAAALVVRIRPDGLCATLGSGALQRPTGVALLDGRLFVADPPSHEIVELGRDGVAVRRFGGLGESAGQLHFPTAIHAASGALLVVDALNFRIARFTPEGEWLGSFGAPGDEGGALARPKGVATDRRGRVYVSDAERDLVLVYAADGTFEYAIGGSGTDPGWFSMPAGLAVVGDALLVADSQNRRIAVFDLLGDET